MDRVSGFAVTTAKELLHRLREPAETGVVLGCTGAVQAMRDFTRTSLLAERPFYVDPSAVPNGVMNCAAGQTAIWHRLTGPNATVATGRTSGLSALAYARRLLSHKRAGAVLAGAVEEYSSMRAWLEFRRDASATPTPLGEGCVLYLVEQAHTASGAPLVELLGVTSRVHPAGDVRSTLRSSLREELERHAVPPRRVWVACPSGAPGEHEAVASVLGNDALGRAPSLAGVGETGTASAAFQIAAILSLAGPPPGSVALVTSVDPGGLLSHALLRFPASDAEHSA